MTKFTLFWLDGTTEVVEGTDIKQAFSNAGYSGGAIRALDYYKQLEEEKEKAHGQTKSHGD